jgi:hypothetical protein
MARRWPNALRPSFSISRPRSRAHCRRGLYVLEALEGRQLLSLLPTPSPTVFMVTDTSDSISDTGSLPYAINQANMNANTAGSLIEFVPADFASPQAINLSSTLTLSEADGAEAIEGPGASLLTISGGGTVRVFQVGSGVTATISDLTISGGRSNSGGGVFNQGNMLTLSGCTITGNKARSGGGLSTGTGTTMFTGCTISDNSASEQGGGVNSYGDTTIFTSCTISGNSASTGGASMPESTVPWCPRPSSTTRRLPTI